MEKRQYMAPQLTMVEFRTERGYASSMLLFVQDQENYNNQCQEEWNDGGNLFDTW